ncbi:MAG: 5'-nucleotidase C-terminal domain-containing protein [Oscillospiraceae bacterium]
MLRILNTALICLTLTLLLRASASAAKPQEVCRVVVENSSELDMKNYQSSEVLLGDIIADAVKNGAGADIAVVNSGDFIPKLRYGDLTRKDVQDMFPQDRELAVTSVTGAELREILEIGLSHIVLTEDETIDSEASAHGAFPQVSGFSFKYDVSAAPMNRVYEITLDSGERINPEDNERAYLLAATGYMLSGGWDMPAREYEATGMTLTDAMYSHLASLGEIDAVPKRQYFRGAINENPLLKPLSAVVIASVVIVLFAAAGILKRRLGLGKAQEEEKENTYDPIE